MSRRILPALAASAVLTLALPRAAAAAPAQRRRRRRRRPARPPPAPAAGAACAESTAGGTVAVSIKDFAFNPATITAKVGDIVQFTNNDTTGHTATLDDGSCTTPTIAGGAADGLASPPRARTRSTARSTAR